MGGMLRRWLTTHPGLSYAGMLATFAIATMIIPMGILLHDASPPAWALGLVLSSAPAMIISVAFTHWIVTRLVRPRVLPKLDKHGLSTGCDGHW